MKSCPCLVSIAQHGTIVDMTEQICKFTKCTNSSHWKVWGKRGWCPKHYKRWLTYGDPSITKRASNGSGCLSKGYKIFNINGKNVFEHRIVMEKHLGRNLEPFEIIHHRDGNRLNNSISNLKVMTQSNHAAIHSQERYAYLRKINIRNCAQCEVEFLPSTYQIRTSKNLFCSRKCASVARRIGGISHIKHYLSH